MTESVFDYLAADHERLDRLLDRAVAVPGVIDRESYGAFRAGLLRHIAMEERILFPAIAKLQEGMQDPVVKQLQLEHGALSALLVPPPDPGIIATLRTILSAHNAREEGDGGIYRLLDRLAGAEAVALLQQMKVTPGVPAAPHNDRPGVLDATRRAVSRAGYTLVRTGP